jgi:single-stranded DNA-binding protein
MNSVIMNGRIVSSPKTILTKNGSTKSVFCIEIDGRDLPLRFSVVCFGNPAEVASKLIEGDEVLLCGRLVASAVTKQMAIVASALELLFQAEPPVTDSTT